MLLQNYDVFFCEYDWKRYENDTGLLPYRNRYDTLLNNVPGSVK